MNTLSEAAFFVGIDINARATENSLSKMCALKVCSLFDTGQLQIGTIDDQLSELLHVWIQFSFKYKCLNCVGVILSFRVIDAIFCEMGFPSWNWRLIRLAKSSNFLLSKSIVRFRDSINQNHWNDFENAVRECNLLNFDWCYHGLMNKNLAISPYLGNIILQTNDEFTHNIIVSFYLHIILSIFISKQRMWL